MLKCFKCDKELNLYSDTNKNPTVLSALDGGLWFRAYGNYGSTVYDPISEHGFLQIAVCDECVLDNLTNVSEIYCIRSNTTGRTKPFILEDN